MRQFIFLLFLVFVQGEFLSQPSVCSFKYRKRITFNPTQVSGSSDLTDFPALIKITSDNDLRTVGNSGHVENASGFDIMFTDADGSTLLNHNLCAYTATSGALTCWVKIPDLSTSLNTYIYMYYGSTVVTTDQSNTGTWSNGYVGVWHLNNALTNSTSVANMNGTNNGSTNTATAMFGTARNFSASSSQYIDITPYNSAYDLNSMITVSAWIRLASTGADQKIAGNQDNSNGGWKFGVFSDNKIEFEIRNSGNSPFLSRSASGGSVLTTNTWYYVVGQYSDPGNAIITYVNGSLDRNYVTAATCGTSTGTMKIGREPFANSAFMNGIMDEIRLSNVIRSADWIATEYNNQNSPSTFYAISAEPKLWLAATNGTWSTGTNWSGGTVPSSGQDVIIKNDVPARQPTLDVSAQVGAIWMYAGSTLNLGAQTLSVSFDILNCGTINGNTGRVVLNSSAIQVQNLSGSTGTYNLNNLTVNNSFGLSPQVTLNRSITVSGALLLTSGIVNTTTTNILAMGNSATSSSGSQSSFVSGPMSKSGSANFTFPIGKGQEWRRLRVSNFSSAALFRAEYFDSPHSPSTPVTSPLTDVSEIEFWQLDRIGAGGDANVSLFWENVGYSYINNCPDLTIAKWNGTSWVETAASAVAGSTCTGSGTGTITTNSRVTSFSPFTFGSKTGGSVNPLPIELKELKVGCLDKTGVITWETASERNNDFFTIERSTDGVNFEKRGTVKGSGNSIRNTTYSYSDKHVPDGLVYYRLRQTDVSGRSEVSKVIVAACETGDLFFSVFPNPNTGSFQVQCQVPITDVRIVNSLGALVQQYESLPANAQLQISQPGVYLLTCTLLNKTQTVKLIVQ